RHRRWLAGFLVGIGGWVLYVAALALAPLSLVQATAAGGIGILALLAWQATGVRPARREIAAVAAAVTGLALPGASLAGQPGLAVVALQLGFQRGTALATAGGATLLTNALPIVAGAALFREGLPGGALGALRVLAFVGVVAGAVGLARAEPNTAPAAEDAPLEAAA